MPVRLRIAIRSRLSGKELLVKALVNTGFTSDTPDIAVPVPLAEALGLWPIPREAISVSMETGGGVVEGYVVPQALVVRVVAEDRVSREVVANALINPHIGEVLISDYLAEELGIQILYPRRGIWRFADEQRERRSA
ncbi:MAG: hypothetical protein DRO39_09160 [Thermoprotei archaeon]|nr:MAG: hypothetical protein DRO39_09160 [Thermoprotei archaeon]